MNFVSHSPPHPGEMLKELYLDPLGLSIQRAARKLKMPAPELSSIMNGNERVSTQVAKKLAKAFKTTQRYWLNMQANYDEGN